LNSPALSPKALRGCQKQMHGGAVLVGYRDDPHRRAQHQEKGTTIAPPSGPFLLRRWHEGPPQISRRLSARARWQNSKAI